MALGKTLEIDAGGGLVEPGENDVVVRYHRVYSVTAITNEHNLVEVASYASAGRREAEKDGAGEGVRVHASWFECPYDQSMTVADAYGYLKGLPLFAGAEDC